MTLTAHGAALQGLGEGRGDSMRIFIAGLGTETNTFAPLLTGAAAFEEGGVFRGDTSAACEGLDGVVARQWRSLAESSDADFCEGLFARAQPSGPAVQAVYEGLRDEIVDGAPPDADVILLHLHGAMVSTECLDCEGDVLARLRRRFPDAVIGALLDPHCHMTDEMLSAADALVLLKHYPHTDYKERAAELLDICLRAANGEIRPVTSVFDCRMVGFYPTEAPVMSEIVAQLTQCEDRAGVLSAAIIHGFPWGDTPETGTRTLVITDGNAELGQSIAEEIGRNLYAAREELLPSYPNLDEALKEAQEKEGRIVLADVADNAGGGAPGDNVSLLRAMLDREMTNAAVGCFWDPVAVAFCADAGVGATLRLRLGGKCGVSSGEPLDLDVRVRAVKADHDQTKLAGSRYPFGASAWVEAGGIDVVITSIRSQTFAPDAFTGLGIDLATKRFIAVKSSQHFYEAFKPIADKTIFVATPGALQLDFATLPYKHKRDLDYFPRVPDPLGHQSISIRSK